MVSAHDIPRIVKQRWRDEVATPNSHITEYPNIEFVRPDTDTEWSRITINVARDTAIIGNVASDGIDVAGSLNAEVFWPISTSTDPTVAEDGGLDFAGESIAPKFDRSAYDGVLYGVPTFQAIGISSGWMQINFRVPFEACETT